MNRYEHFNFVDYRDSCNAIIIRPLYLLDSVNRYARLWCLGLSDGILF